MILRSVGAFTIGVVIGIGGVACTSANNQVGVKRNNTTTCEAPKFGPAEMSFSGCKPIDAFNQLTVLAEANDPASLYAVGRVYDLGGKQFGLPEIPQDHSKAIQYYLRSAQGGYAEAQATMGIIYWREYRDSKEKEALYWWCRAAIQGNYEGAVNIQDQISYEKLNESVQQYCESILRTPQ